MCRRRPNPARARCAGRLPLGLATCAGADPNPGTGARVRLRLRAITKRLSDGEATLVLAQLESKDAQAGVVKRVLQALGSAHPFSPDALRYTQRAEQGLCMAPLAQPGNCPGRRLWAPNRMMQVGAPHTRGPAAC